MLITACGQVIDGFLTGGNRHDIAVCETLTEDIFGCHVLEDRGYDSNKNRAILESQNNVAVIPGRKNRKVPIVYDEELYKERGAVERIFGKIKENRRLAVRYEKSDLHFLSIIAFAFIKLNLC